MKSLIVSKRKLFVLIKAIQQSHENGTLKVYSPIDGKYIGSAVEDDDKSLLAKTEDAIEAFEEWRTVPAPRRGELVRLFGEELRKEKEALGSLITLETGKLLTEGLGEVQEMIDICDFAVGLSRQLYGLTMPSERPGHTMREVWHPIGPIGVISAFNFPGAVWAWNAALAFVCGNSVVWKPSEKTPLTALACKLLFDKAAIKFGDVPKGLMQVVIGSQSLGKSMAQCTDLPVISATGSTKMGRSIGPAVAERFGRSILELGGNNAMIVTPSADLDMAIRSIVFSAVGTCGQRCTTLRRLFIHEDIYDDVVERVKTAYKTIKVGDPFKPDTLMGPLIDEQALADMDHMLNMLIKTAGTGINVIVHGGEEVIVNNGVDQGYYVKPALVELPYQTGHAAVETFAPILYCMKYKYFDDAIFLQNDVTQGLSSSIFTNDIREAELFLSAVGSDCGIANVNIGPSGAEIGGAFGGEKETGGGRESGSDAWKAYMRRSTQTVNYSTELSFAQGIEFESVTSDPN